jgi:uncharacterized repeat protein (TIGR03843 family)
MPADELTAHRLEVLARGTVELVGRMAYSSNATFLAELCHEGEHARAIYKPRRGERPLWDFSPGLHRRERAAFVLSEELCLDLVPPTVVRADAPAGEGSVQWFVDHDPDQHYFTLLEARPDLRRRLQDVAVFDLVANNTDRKSGHVLIDPDDHVWGIDHGLCFAADFKLRTVVWDFGGEPIPDDLVAAVERLTATVPTALAGLLDGDELDALQERAGWVVEHPVFPVDTSGRRYPWPLV